MRAIWKKPGFWIIFSLSLMGILLVFTYIFRDSLLSLSPSTSTEKNQSSVQNPAEGPVTLDIKLTCPVPEEFCQTASVIDEGETWRGIGFNLPTQSSILALFAGKIENKPEFPDKPATQTLFYLRDKQGHEVTYSFYGTQTAKAGTQVKAGAKIGTITEGAFPSVAPFTGLNTVIILKQNNRFVPLAPEDFVK